MVQAFQPFVVLCLNDFPVWTHSSAFNGKLYIVLNKGRAELLNKLFVQVAPMLSALASGRGSKYLLIHANGLGYALQCIMHVVRIICT